MAVNTVIMLIIALVVLVVIVTMFYTGDNALFVKIKKILPDPLEFIKPGMTEGSDPTLGEKEKPIDLFNKFSLAVLTLANDPEPNCFYPLENLNLNDLFDEHSIYARSLKGTPDTTVLYLVNDLGQANNRQDGDKDLGLKTPENIPTFSAYQDRREIQDTTLCIVVDDVADTFYNNWLVDKNPKRSFTVEDYNPITTTDENSLNVYLDDYVFHYIDEGEDLHIGIKPDSKGELLLYKRTYTQGGNPHQTICLFATKSDFSARCTLHNKYYKKYGEKIDILGSDCFDTQATSNKKQSIYQKLADKTLHIPQWDEQAKKCVIP